MQRDRYPTSSYMYWVTDNVDTYVQGQTTIVACVYCVEIYETDEKDELDECHNCLICKKCSVDAVMVVKHSPLLEMTNEDRMKKLAEWHVDGFTPIPRKQVNNGSSTTTTTEKV